MKTNGQYLGLMGWLALATLALPTALHAQEHPTQPARAIPGITTEDPFPNGCVSCHVVLPDGRDVRLSTLLAGWTGGVDTLLLALAQSSAPSGVTLAGVHPDAAAAVTDIPSGCLLCHNKTSRLAPPFTRLVHRIHLTGGEQSVYLSMFGGECTYCHKLDLTTGAWTIPSGPEP